MILLKNLLWTEDISELLQINAVLRGQQALAELKQRLLHYYHYFLCFLNNNHPQFVSQLLWVLTSVCFFFPLCGSLAVALTQPEITARLWSECLSNAPTLFFKGAEDEDFQVSFSLSLNRKSRFAARTATKENISQFKDTTSAFPLQITNHMIATKKRLTVAIIFCDWNRFFAWKLF